MTPSSKNLVLKEGKTHFTENTINGENYKSAYWPMRTADGAIAGMWFVGAPISALRQHENAAIYKTVFVTLGVLLALLLLSLLVGLKNQRAGPARSPPMSWTCRKEEGSAAGCSQP